MIMGLITLTVTAVILVVVRLMVRRRGIGIAPRLFAVISLVLLAAGIGLTLFSSYRLQSAFAMRDWPTVTGKVVDSRVTGNRAIAPQVIYEYTVRGSHYVDTSHLHVPMFGNRRKEFEVARTVSEEYAVGQTLLVFYSPDMPSLSTLTPGATWDLYVKGAFGVMLFALGLLGLLFRQWDLRRVR
jgi:hypothetical protein